VVPILFLLASVGMVLNALVTEPKDTGITLGIILAGVPAYYAWRAWSPHAQVSESTAKTS
jgi:APA family basic amino acid/polyamine antiporter